MQKQQAGGSPTLPRTLPLFTSDHRGSGVQGCWSCSAGPSPPRSCTRAGEKRVLFFRSKYPRVPPQRDGLRPVWLHRSCRLVYECSGLQPAEMGVKSWRSRETPREINHFKTEDILCLTGKPGPGPWESTAPLLSANPTQ